MDNLSYIRATMEQAGRFTAVPGTGAMWIGAVGLIAALVAAPLRGTLAWLAVWAGAALLAGAIGVTALRAKARRTGVPLATGPGRKFVLGFVPPLVLGAALTGVALREEVVHLLPGLWLSLYGIGVMSAGSFSVRVVPFSGFVYLCLGLVAFLVPPAWSDALLGLGFGVLHVAFGAVIRRRYGG